MASTSLQTKNFDPRSPFSRAQARAAGITVSDLLSKRYRRLFHDAYIDADVAITTAVLANAAIGISADGSFASHQTAARLWGGCVPHDPDVHVSVPDGGYRTRRRGVKAHLANPGADVVVFRGVRTSSPAQCVLDLAGRLGLVDLVVLGDSLVKAGVVTTTELCDAAERWDGHGAKLARRAAALVRSDVESPMETRLRLLIVLAGLPEPVIQHEVVEAGGRVRMRLDLSYPGWRIAIEYDGRQHAESSEQWQRDVTRREALDRLGWRVLVVSAHGIYSDPAGTLSRIVQTLHERGVAGYRPAGQEWRRHFPGRRAV